MIGSIPSRRPRASQTKGAVALQPGVLGTGAPRRGRQWAACVAQALVSVDACAAVLLQDALGVFDSSRVRRLVKQEETHGRSRKTQKKTEGSLF